MLTIFTSENALTSQGRRLVETVVERAREEGLAGASVIRGVEGFGHSRHRRTTRFPDVAVDLPVVVQIVDSSERIAEFVPLLRTLAGDELVVMQPVTIDNRPQGRPVLDDQV
jgi:PII-like signaling protein